MKDKAALAIAALMFTSMAYALSTTTVSATHTSSAKIAPDLVKEDKSYIFTLTVRNESGDNINEVSITVPTGFKIIGGITKIPKDNIVGIDNSTDRLVIVKKGEWVQLKENTENVILPENTVMIRENGENVVAVATGVDYILQENARIKIHVGKYAKVTLAENENLIVRVDDPTLVSVTGDNVKLVNTISAVLVSSVTAKLVEDTLVYLPVSGTTNATTENLENVMELKNEVPDIKITPSTDKDNFILMHDAKAKKQGVEATTLAAGTHLKLVAPNENVVSLPAGTKVELPSGTSIRILENTKVIRPIDNLINLRPATLPNIENVPAGWSWKPNKWTGIGENVIKAGDTLDFPVAIKTPTAGGEYKFTITTKDVAGYSTELKVKITVDNTTPSVVELKVDKDYVSKATPVVITLKASEVLAVAPLVYVQQGYTTDAVTKENAKENFRVTMTSTDNITWTGTFTTIDAVEKFDNYAKIWVENMVDAVDHVGEGSKDKAFFVDSLAPPVLTYERDSLRLVKAENLAVDIKDLLPLDGKQTNVAKIVVTGRAVDNVLGKIENKAGLKVEVLSDDAIIGTATSLSDNTFNVPATLKEGLNRIKVRVIDKAGNVGAENVLEWFCDTKKPTITPVSIGGIAYKENMWIRENVGVVIKLTIADPGYAENLAIGIENRAYEVVSVKGYPDQLTGFSVQLDNTDLAAKDLVNAKPWTRGLIEFENVLPALTQGNHYIFVIAGDNLQQENGIVMRFRVDSIAPVPDVDLVVLEKIGGTTDEPIVIKSTSRTISGVITSKEVGGTIKVYIDGVHKPEYDLVTTTTTWTRTVTIPQGKTTKIEFSLVDQAGNESARVLYGYALVDVTAPTVTLTPLPEMTDKRSILVSGTVTKDAWEKYTDITVHVQVGTFTTTVRPLPDGSWSTSTALVEGVNRITVWAVDAFGNSSDPKAATIEVIVTPLGTYAIILVIIALVLAAIAILRRS